MTNESLGYNNKLPENIREIFMSLCQDLANLQQKWDFNLELFWNKENNDLFSGLVPASSNIIFEALRSDITMAICRLSDKSATGKQKNLSLATLIELCPEIEGLATLFDDFNKLCTPLMNQRNKKVAHTDLNTIIKPSGNPLPGISKEQIDKILLTAANILNTIYRKYDDSDRNFHTKSYGGADALIFYLKEGKESASHFKPAVSL